MGTSNIADKVVVITRVSSGIGGSTAELLARHTISPQGVSEATMQMEYVLFRNFAV